MDIHTIGYGNRRIEDFIDLLKKYSIHCLVDVRSIPYSRFHVNFRKSVFEAHLKRADIRYHYLGEALGGRPADPGLYTVEKLDYEKLRQTGMYQKGILEVIAMAKQGENVCLMCSELSPDHCHRKHLLAPDLLDKQVNVLHIDEKGSLRQHSGEKWKLF